MPPPIPPAAPTAQDVRDALRVLRVTHEREADVVEAWIDHLAERVVLLGSEDSFRLFVLEQAHRAGETQALLTRLDNTVIQDLAEAERLRAEVALADASNRAATQLTVRRVLSQPAVLALIGVLSTVMSGIGAVIMQLVFGGSP